ncbi:MAG: hypothetical protein IJ629_04145 [Clostridia bacterium]|nr:hypothetical protein [Clostridia bacterium]
MIRSFKFKMIIALFLVVLAITVSMPVVSLAIDKNYLEPGQFDNRGYTQLADTNIPGTHGTLGSLLRKFFGVIYAIVRTIALGWAILMLLFIAMKYFTGSAQVKAQLKVDIPTYLIGAVILFGSTGLLALINYFIQDYIK